MSEKAILIKLPEDLHARVKGKASGEGKTLKQFVIEALEAAVK